MPENEGQPQFPHHPHDKGYRQLLSDKRVFLELLKTFVREKWVEAIDANDLILVNKSYVLQDFSGHLLDYRYLLFDVNRYNEEELIRAANLIASVFLLDQKMRPEELAGRLQKLSGILRRLTPDEFRHITSWLKNVVKPRIPEDFREKVDRILDASNPWEVERMIYNLELTLEEMQQQALLKGLKEGEQKGKLEGKLEGKREVARNLLLFNVDIETIVKATGLTPDEIAVLKKQLEQ
ncbi:hypothetical protein MHOCP_04140 [Moorella humiferrea]|uniref:hypothetical protein n=1 Tax=Neomoorella humiferrea TaxID=676965 RepID=UPI0030CD7016